MTEERFEVVETYSNFWQLKTTLYSFEGKTLPIPIPADLIFYYGLVMLIVLFLGKVPIVNLIFTLPLINEGVIRTIILPIPFAMLLNHIKLDGKSPYHFLIDSITYLINPKRYEYFKVISMPKSKKIKIKMVFKIEKLDSIVNKNKINKKSYRCSHEYL